MGEVFGTQIEMPSRSQHFQIRADWNPMIGRKTFTVVAPSTEDLLVWLREFATNIETAIQNIESREGG
jgi:hypothetical protein